MHSAGGEEPEDDSVLDGPAAYDEPDDSDDFDEGDLVDTDDEQEGG